MQRLEKATSLSGQGCFILFGLFWTTFAVIWTIAGWKAGGLFWLLFGSVFILIGLVMLVGGLWRFFLRIKIAEPEISVSRTDLQPGEHFNVSYEQKFRQACEVEQITIKLVFREAATYTQGTDTRTDRYDHIEDEFSLPGKSYQAGEKIQQSFSLRIPQGGMHSFDAANNKLQWFVAVHVSVRGWPDMQEDFEVTVLPGRVW